MNTKPSNNTLIASTSEEQSTALSETSLPGSVAPEARRTYERPSLTRYGRFTQLTLTFTGGSDGDA